MNEGEFHAGIDINSPHAGPVYRANLPKRAAPPVPSRYSPMTTGCGPCDFVGPLESRFQSGLLELHRALHRIWTAVLFK